MITVRNEFEPVPAFTHIAGCSLGTWSARSIAFQMVKTLETVSSTDTYAHLYKELAEINDDDESVIWEIADDACELLNATMPMPEFCNVVLEDGEYRVIPDLESAQEDCHMFTDYPDKKIPDSHYEHILVVNDHGNVTCQQWDTDKYITIWDIV